MSPEQLRNDTKIDGRADLWSLGVVAYELLTGAPPFDGDGVGEIFAAILEQEAIPLHVRNPKIPETLSAVIGKCLARNPDDRWLDAAEMARAIAPFGTSPYQALVERIDQVLVRAKMLSTSETPLDTRRVVDAIAAAAELARTNASMSPPSSKRYPENLETEADLRTSRYRGRRRVGLAVAAGLSGLLALGIFVSVRGTRAATAATLGTPATARDARDAVAFDDDVISFGTKGRATTGSPDSQGTSARQDEDESGSIVELDNEGHPVASSGVRSRSGRTAKPQRPKFLKTRE
jgi:serine/threonine-protein kinase